jgi:hypothetical protein
LVISEQELNTEITEIFLPKPQFQNFDVSVDVWKFFLFSEYDNWYHAGQAPLLQEKPPYPSKDAGTEIDITLSYNWKNLSISCGYSPLTPEEMEIAKQIFFNRCAGCYGVLRKGATDPSLLPENRTRLLGTEGIKVFITYGTLRGMHD